MKKTKISKPDKGKVLLEDIAVNEQGLMARRYYCDSTDSLLALKKKGFTSCCMEREMTVMVLQPPHVIVGNKVKFL